MDEAAGYICDFSCDSGKIAMFIEIFNIFIAKKL